MPCLDPEELERYLANDSDDAWSSQASAHLATCSDCSSRMAELREYRKIEGSVRHVLAGRSAVAEQMLGQEVGAYRIIRELGRGGMGVVYEAEQQNPPRRVALKLLDPSRPGQGSAERLLRREARVLARLRHPSVAAIYEAGQTPDGRPFFAMERVEGVSLLAHAQQHGLSIRQRLELFATVCETVAYAHQRGVIHRDLKPSNVLVERDGRPKVLDFGLARIMEMDANATDVGAPYISSLVEPARIFGTLPYMSPEHVRGDPADIDVRSDVYALGVMLYELLTQRLPYPIERSNIARSARLIAEQPPTPPSEIRRELRGDVETIMLKALAKDPERRYASAAEFAADIHRHQRSEPIAARPPTTWYQFRKFAGRNKALVGTAAASVVLLLGVTAAAVGQAYVATRERDAAQRRLAYARQTADYVLKGVANQLGTIPGTEPVRRHIAEEAYVFYKRLAEESPDDLAAQADLWHVMRILAHDARWRGNVARAELLGGQVLRLVERVAAARPDDPAQWVAPDDPLIQRQIAETYLLASALPAVAGDPQEYERRSFQIRLRLADWVEKQPGLGDPASWSVAESGPEAGRQPLYVRARFDRASVYGWMATQAIARDELDEAEQYATEALSIYEELSRTDPTRTEIFRQDVSEYAPLAGPISLRFPEGPAYERLKAATHTMIGNIALRRGDGVEAEQCYRTALDIVAPAASAAPDEPSNMAALASAHSMLATFLLNAGDAVSAVEHGLAALSLHTRLAGFSRSDPSWQQHRLADFALLVRAGRAAHAPQVSQWEQSEQELRAMLEERAGEPPGQRAVPDDGDPNADPSAVGTPSSQLKTPSRQPR
jgi:serine/threonine protein kinase